MKPKKVQPTAKPSAKPLNNFNPTILPGWARRCREVVSLSAVNIEFRRNVITATDPRYKRILIKKAREVISGGRK